jgi:hypothetical protein
LHLCVHLLGFFAVSMHRFCIAKLFSHFHYTAFTDVNMLCDIQHVLTHQIRGCQELLQL